MEAMQGMAPGEPVHFWKCQKCGRTEHITLGQPVTTAGDGRDLSCRRAAPCGGCGGEMALVRLPRLEDVWTDGTQRGGE